jgi:hypothetical protein
VATRSPIDTHNHWGQYSTVADLPNISGAGVQDDALETGDTAFVTGTSALYVCVSATLGAAQWTYLGNEQSDERLAFIWNGVDASQFDAPTATWQSSANITTTLSGVSAIGYPGTNRLRARADVLVAGSNEYCIWLAKEPLPFTGTERNFRIELLASFASRQYGGYAFLCDPGGGLGLHGYALTSNSTTGTNPTWPWRVDAGVVANNPLTSRLLNLGFPTDGGFWDVVIEADKPAASPPRFWHNTQGRGPTVTYAIGSQQFDYAGALPASWNNLDCAYWGLALSLPSSLAVGNADIMDFSSVRVWVW